MNRTGGQMGKRRLDVSERNQMRSRRGGAGGRHAVSLKPQDVTIRQDSKAGSFKFSQLRYDLFAKCRL